MGGALGNLVDRVRFRAVVDFLDVYWGDWHWPAFNVADSAIFVGAALACLILWRKPPAAASDKGGKPTPGKGGTAWPVKPAQQQTLPQNPAPEDRA